MTGGFQRLWAFLAPPSGRNTPSTTGTAGHGRIGKPEPEAGKLKVPVFELTSDIHCFFTHTCVFPVLLCSLAALMFALFSGCHYQGHVSQGHVQVWWHAWGFPQDRPCSDCLDCYCTVSSVSRQLRGVLFSLSVTWLRLTSCFIGLWFFPCSSFGLVCLDTPSVWFKKPWWFGILSAVSIRLHIKSLSYFPTYN